VRLGQRLSPAETQLVFIMTPVFSDVQNQPLLTRGDTEQKRRGKIDKESGKLVNKDGPVRYWSVPLLAVLYQQVSDVLKHNSEDLYERYNVVGGGVEESKTTNKATEQAEL